MSQREFVVELEDEATIAHLKAALSAADRTSTEDQDRLELLIDRFAGLRVEVFAREHPPPHFRVIGGGESANYRIADCVQLNGDLRRQYRAVKAWHAANKPKIIEAWNRRRPSDCPVGEYREV